MVCLDWSLPKDDKPDTPTMLFLPGLTGESQADYIQGFVRSANSLGVRSVVFNYRGLGGIPLKVGIVPNYLITNLKFIQAHSSLYYHPVTNLEFSSLCHINFLNRLPRKMASNNRI